MCENQVFSLISSIEMQLVDSGSNAAAHESKKLMEFLPLSLSEKDRIKVILRLKELLLNENQLLVENIVIVLLDLIQSSYDRLCLPMNVVLALVKKCKEFFEDLRYATFENIIELLESLFYFQSESNLIEVQEMFRELQCLNLLLTILCNMNFEDSNLSIIEGIVNIMIYATCTPVNFENSCTAMEAVSPLVLDFLCKWINNSSASTTLDRILKDLLFLVRSIVRSNTLCQHIFLECEGIETLISALQSSEKLSHHMEILMPLRKSDHIDNSKTIFSSVVMLLDEAITSYKEACCKAEELGAINVLEQCLGKINDTEQQAIVISSIVHIMEVSSLEPRKMLVHKMYNLANGGTVTTPILKFLKKNSLENNNKAESKIKARVKGTPHPRKHLKTDSKKPFRKQSQSPSVSMQRQAVVTATKHGVSSSSHSVKKLKHVCFVSAAEIIVLMNCVRIHGINMQDVRKVWPFHKELTPGDLYGLWRAIWPKKYSQLNE